MTSRRHNPRRAKSHFSYTVYEVAELYDVGRPTVRHWLANGLEPNGGPWESYVDDPTLTAPDQLRTEIFVPVR